ncbi:hypothetical protein NIES4072_64260 [Nostoc commune NIES-4072]|uniref:Macro domain-containing protein n=1 Tax=Nostoc commune NIES-4072 TaxID=2005467 RepID=A0A2R5G4J2_NOSCO|nr:hypothetical protein NIES4070_64570 [Nostoc commune HK-02]GBG22714.1 hypothetical protein NIES4072_64260 [Nostoc commune NIES-4072]
MALVQQVQRLDITSIAIPALGCGNGGLNWADVKPLIESAFAQLPDVQVIIFEPLSQTSTSIVSRRSLWYMNGAKESAT